MNKLLTKIVGVVLGTTMAIGVGVGVAVNNSRDVVDSEVRATTDSRDWDLVTDASTLSANDIVTFVTGEISSKRYATTNVTNATGLSYLVYDSTAVTVTNNSITGLDAITHGFKLTGNSSAWKIVTLTESTANNSAFIDAWLYKTGTSNNVGLTTDSTQTGADWTISIDSTTYVATVKNGVQKSSKDMVMRFNSNSGSQRFACYQYDTQKDIYLFKARASAQVPTITFASSGAFSSYSGEQFTVNGTYSNLTGAPNYSITANSDKVSNLSWTAGDGAFSLTGTAGSVNSDTAVSITVSKGSEATASGTLTIHPAEVTSISLDITKKHLVGINSTFTLTPTLEGHGSYSETIQWETNDTDVATVSSGVVTAIGSGVATITANAANNQSATCTVVVTKANGTTKANAFEAGEARLLVINSLYDSNAYVYVKGYVREKATQSNYVNLWMTSTSDESYTASTSRTTAFEIFRAATSGDGVVNPSSVSVGNFINVYGKLTKYGDQAEMASGCTIVRELVSLTYTGTPVEQHTGVAFDPDGLTFTGTFDDSSTREYSPSELTFTTPDVAGNNKTVTATVTGTEVSVTITGLTVTDIHATSVTLQSTGEVIVGKTLDLEYSISPAGYVDTVTFTSSDPSKATVTEEGVVTGVAEADDVTITLSTSNGLSATCSISVTTGALRIGAKYVLTSFADQLSVFKTIETVGSSTAGSVKTYSHYVEHDYALTIEVGTTDGTFAFKTADNKYIAAENANTLVASDTKTAAASWDVTKNDDGSYEINNKDQTNRYLQYNPGSSTVDPRFAAYKGTMNDPIFLPVNNNLLAGSFVQKYMHVEIATNVEGTGACTSEGWYTTAKAAFFDATSPSDTDFHLNAVQRLEVKNSYNDYYLRLQAWARANSEEIDINEGGTDIVQSANTALNNIIANNNSTTVAVIVVISAIGLSTLCGYFLLRKRKEER